MSKGALKIKRKSSRETYTFDPRMNPDKRSFVLLTECTQKMSWFDAVVATKIWAQEEIDRLGMNASDAEH